MDDRKRFHAKLREMFFPLLRKDGFRGSGATLRRVTGGTVHVVNVQGSRSRRECYVNLGVHCDVLPCYPAGRELNQVLEVECEIRRRLAPRTELDWSWNYGTDDAEAEASVLRLQKIYKQVGRPFFTQLSDLPRSLKGISADDINAGDLSTYPGSSTRVRAALTISRVWAAAGDHERSAQFAKIGLAHIGRATGLKRELQHLREAAG